MKPERVFLFSIVVIMLVVVTLGLSVLLGSQWQQLRVIQYVVIGGIVMFMVFHKRKK